MNLVKQFRAFGIHIEEHQLPMDVQTLYYNIMQLFNKNMWPEQLVIETYKLENNCQMTRKRITACRQFLIEKGYIKYTQSKYASGSPAYELVFLYETQKGKRVFPDETHKKNDVFQNEPVSVSQGNTKETPRVSQGNTFNKTLKPNKQNITVPKGTGSSKKSKAEKNKEEIEATPHWKKLVDVWFKFYEKNFFMPPSFSGADPRNLKYICDNLQKRAISKQFEWTEEKAADTFTAFLQFAYSEEWLKKNFLLQNLYRQFDKIITNATNNKKGTVASAFSKIDAITGLNGK